MSNLIGALSHLVSEQVNLSKNENVMSANLGTDGFKGALKEKLEVASSDLQFSKHAMTRLSDRNINLSNKDIERLARATDVASKKGAKDALLMLDDLSLIVNINNRIVVTAMQAGEIGDSVYTNIDTAVVVGEK